MSLAQTLAITKPATIWHPILGSCGGNSGQQCLEDQLEGLN